MAIAIVTDVASGTFGTFGALGDIVADCGM